MPVAAPILGNIAINLAIGIGTSLIAAALKPAQKKTDSSASQGTNFELSLGESVPLSAIWGRGRTGGHLVFAQEYGDDNVYLKLVFACGKGTYDAFETLLVDEKLTTLEGSNGDTDGKEVVEYRLNDDGEVDPAGEPYMWIKTYDGSPGQVADPGLIAAANPDSRWTSNHTLTRTPYVVVTMRYHAELYGGSIPSFGFVWRGLKLYDWREDSTVDGGSGSQRWSDQTTWAWTENPHVIAYNWRRGYWINGVKVFGLGFPSTANDLAYFTAGANVSDETILYPETSVTLARYAFGRAIGDDEDRLEVLRELEGCWCGASFSRGGAYAPVQAQTQTAIGVIGDSDRLQGYSVRADLYGTVSGKKTAYHGEFVSRADAWQTTPYGTRISASLESLLGGRRSIQLNQNFEYRQERAQMRAEISLRRNLYPATRTETFNPRALVYEVGDCITRQCEWGDVLMIVDGRQELPNKIGVTLTMSEWNNAIVPASGESFIDIPPSSGDAPADPQRTLTVSGLAVDPYAIQGEDATLPGARATWTHISDPNVQQVMIRYWPAAGSEALDAQDVFASSKLQDAKIFGPLADSTTYFVKATVVRSDDRTPVWSTTTQFVSGVTSVPSDGVAPGSITPEMLGQELSNAYGVVSDDFSGSMPEQIAYLKDLAEQLAVALMTGDLTNKRRISILSAQLGSSVAAVIRNEVAIAETNAALASVTEEVIAAVNDGLASGLFKVEAQVVDANASAYALLKVRAAVGQNFSEAALRLKAEFNGVSNIASIEMMADRLVFISTAGDVISQPFSIEGGVVKLEVARAGRITSADGVSMVIDFDQQEIYMEG